MSDGRKHRDSYHMSKPAKFFPKGREDLDEILCGNCDLPISDRELQLNHGICDKCVAEKEIQTDREEIDKELDEEEKEFTTDEKGVVHYDSPVVDIHDDFLDDSANEPIEEVEDDNDFDDDYDIRNGN